MKRVLGTIFAVSIILATSETTMAAGKPIVTFKTNMGDFTVQLEPERAPKTVANFLEYVRDGHYDGTIFHRVIAKFMVQGGGFLPNLQKRVTRGPITNEANTGLKNERGTIAMARTADPHSATAQFFVNVIYNRFLDHTAKTLQGWGYTAFGRVIDGMNIVGRMARVKTGTKGPYSDVPNDPIIIEKATVISE